MNEGNAMPARMATAKLGPKKERRMRGFRVRFADNGGAVVSHDMEGEPYGPDPEHVFSTADEAHAHIKTLFPSAMKTPRGNIQEPGEQA